nr:hypothetical protein [Opitutales bacterium]
MTNNSVVKSSAVDQLIQYFDISNACLEGLSKVLEGSHEGLVNDICPSATICPKSESLIQQTELHARHAQTISGAMSDPIAKYQDQFEESESAILDKQNPIKDKIRAQIVDTRQTIDALLVQTKLLQTAETCQKERKQIIDDGKIIKNNLQENFEKIATHIRNSNIEN